MESFFSRLFGKCNVKQTANDSVEKTDAYHLITWWIILWPNFTQSHFYKDFYKTSAATCTLYINYDVHVVCDPQDSLCVKNKYLEHVFLRNNYNSDFIRQNTGLLKLMQWTGTWHLSLQQLYLTLPRPSHICVAHKPTTMLWHLLTYVKDRDEPNNR